MSRPFILLASSRKGTHLVTTALAKHPDVVVYKQPFTENAPAPLPGATGPELAAHFFDGPKPAAILSMWWDQARDTYPGFWDELHRRKVGVIFLHRQNMVQWYVSQEIAKRTQAWSVDSPPRNAPCALAINPQAAEWDIEHDWRNERLAKRFFHGHNTCHMWYEWLTAGFAAHLGVIQDFLGVPRLPLAPSCFKQQRWPLQDVVANFAEIVNEWRGTQYEHMVRAATPKEVPPDVTP